MPSLETLHRSRRARLALSVVLTCVGLLFVEGILRLTWGSPRVDGLDDSIEELKRFNRGCFEVRQDENGEELLERNGIEGLQRTTREPRPGVRRVILVGESTGDYLGAHVREILAHAKAPREDFEFLNCGMNGLNLSHLQAWLEEVYALHPDTVVLVFGHNGFDVPERATSDVWLEIWRWAMKSHVAKGIISVPNIGFVTPERYHEQVALMKDRIQWMVERSKADGVRLIVSTLASNLRFPPSALDLPWARGRERWRRTLVVDRRAAMPEALVWHEGEETANGLWPYLEGMARLGTGDPEGARALLQVALENDPAAARAHRSVDSLLESGEDWEVFPLARIVEDASEQPVPEWDVFEDIVHPRPWVMHRAAWALLEFLEARPPGEPPTCGREDFALEHWFDLHRTLRRGAGVFVQRAGLVDRVASAVVGGKASPKEVLRSARGAAAENDVAGNAVLQDACLGLARARRYDDARALLELGERGDDPDFVFTAARIEVMAGENEAARTLLQRTRALDPEHLGAEVYLEALSE